MKLTKWILPVLMLSAAPALAQGGATANQTLAYPPAHRGKVVDNYFGTKVAAPYRWMENLDSPAVKQWVTAENNLTFSYLAKIPLRGWINKRLTQLWNYAKEGTPTQATDGALFFSRNSGLQN